MRTTIAVTNRGVITLPLKLRKELGITGEDLLIAETTTEGLLLKPAVAVPVQIYTKDQLEEFAAAEADLADWYAENQQRDQSPGNAETNKA